MYSSFRCAGQPAYRVAQSAVGTTAESAGEQHDLPASLRLDAEHEAVPVDGGGSPRDAAAEE